jgi:hypothetical protein
MRRRLVVLVAGTAVLLVPSAVARADNPVLNGTVGPGFSISLRNAAGSLVRHLDAGTYTIQVHDLSEIHNFHLLGPGVEMASSVEDVQELSWTVTFSDGIYRFHCDPHAGIMRGSFAVGTAVLPPPATKLSASVGPARKISLRNSDGTKLTLLQGTTAVVVTVNDRSRADNFHLIGKGVSKATGIGFRGRATWRLTLRPGKYVYRSDKHKTLRGSFTVIASA